MGKRITLRLDDRIEKTLDALGSRANRGQFIRAAIHFYLNHHETMEKIEKELVVINKKIGNLQSNGKPNITNAELLSNKKGGYNKEVFLGKFLSQANKEE